MIKIRMELIFWSLVLIFVAGVISNLGLSLMLLNPVQNSLTYFMIFTLSMIVGFVWLPDRIISTVKLGYHKLSDRIQVFNLKRYLISLSFMILLNTLYFQGKEFWFQVVIATCEEVLFRLIIFNLLRREFSEWWTVLISSLLFACLLHLNYNLADNLLVRFPIGITLALLARYKGLHTSIFIHWLINMLAGKFS